MKFKQDEVIDTNAIVCPETGMTAREAGGYCALSVAFLGGEVQKCSKRKMRHAEITELLASNARRLIDMFVADTYNDPHGFGDELPVWRAGAERAQIAINRSDLFAVGAAMAMTAPLSKRGLM
jgi:hypothetical protein